ncbi:MAG: hypothetical protein PHI73_00460 [Patescibacteria group bacterium]|nr:hypothetical protein [Patescibacteria group bacterium]
MDKIYNIIIISTASIVASILTIIGFRKLKVNKYKKYGLFMSTLLIAFTLSGCDLLEKTDKTNTNIKQNKTTPQTVEYKSGRIKLLNNTSEWKNFKTFWQKLDDIVPKNKTDDTALTTYYGEYADAITQEQAEIFKGELTTLINSLEGMTQEELVLSDTEIDLIEKICQERISYMSTGFSSMIMRMIPPITLTDKENSIKDLEFKIDTLIELRNKGIVSSDDFTQAQRLIWQDIELFSILDTISSHYTVYYANNYYDNGVNKTSLLRTAQYYINAFEENYQSYLIDKKSGTKNINIYYPEDIESKYKETKEEIEKVKIALPQLNELIQDLVTNE